MGLSYGFDLGINCGWACGAAGDKPSEIESGVWVLKKPKEPLWVAWATLEEKLCREFANPPKAVGVEQMLTLAALKKLKMSEAVIWAHHGYHVILRKICYQKQILLYEVHPNVMRKHFLGQVSLGGRRQTKAGMVKAGQVLGYLPKDSKDDNQADACGVLDWLINDKLRQLDLFERLAKS